MKIVIKSFLSNISHYSISCDCWSTYDVNFKAICFFIHVYQEGHYRSLLLDVKPLQDSKSQSIKTAYQEVLKEYSLNPADIPVVCDNASSNVAAFENKLTCFAHAFNTACAHLINMTADDKSSIYGIELKDREYIFSIFSVAETVCQLFRGAMLNELGIWYEQYKDKMPDLNHITLKKPGKPCATRWLERINHFEYLREYGVLIFRFLCCSNCKPINLPLLYNCLVQLPEILFLLNVVNNSLETLAYEKKATAHLVLPILEELKKFFNYCRINCTCKVPKLMAKSFLYELEKGCLKPNEYELPYYQCASACYKSLTEINPDLMKTCVNTANGKYKEFFDKYYPDREFVGYENMFSGLKFSYSTVPQDVIKELINNTIYFHDAGANKYFLVGELLNQYEPAFLQSLAILPEKEIDRLKSIYQKARKAAEKESKKKRGRPPKNADTNDTNDTYDTYDMIYMIEKWKSNGCAEDDKNPASNLPKSINDLLNNHPFKKFISTKRSPSIFINPVAESTEGYQNLALRELYEFSLCTAPTEADCERFFRILSLFVKKQYRTNMKADTWCKLSFLKYYGKEIYFLFGYGRNDKTNIENVLLDI